MGRVVEGKVDMSDVSHLSLSTDIPFADHSKFGGFPNQVRWYTLQIADLSFTLNEEEQAMVSTISFNNSSGNLSESISGFFVSCDV